MNLVVELIDHGGEVTKLLEFITTCAISLVLLDSARYLCGERLDLVLKNTDAALQMTMQGMAMVRDASCVRY